jgi:nucleotide-binding universal stress UspA family protein
MKILIPVDESDASLRAIDWVAKATNGQGDAEVALVNVRQLPDYHGSLSELDFAAIDRALRESQQRVLTKALHHATHAGLQRTTVHAAQGLPGEQIVAAANELGAHQIAMTTHGRGTAGSFFLGSVAHQVVHRASIPVTMVK